jgi:soluble lytic murein transglycosylase
MTRLRLFAFGFLSLVATMACSRRPVGQASGVLSSGEPQGSASVGPNAGEPPTKVDLDWSSEPVLATPELAEVRDALESRDDELASLTLHDVLGKTAPTPGQRARWYYLLGLVEERLKETARARSAYREAAKDASPLRWDALLHLADLEISVGNCPLARQAIASIGSQSLGLDELAAVRGRMAACEGDWATARREFAVAVDLASTANLKAYYQSQLAERLLAQLGPCGARSPAERDEVAALIARAKESSSRTPVLTKRFAAVLAQLACPNQPQQADVTLEQALSFAEELLDQRRFSEAAELLLPWEAQLDVSQSAMPGLCRIQFAQGRAAAGVGRKRDAEHRYEWVAQNCDDADLVPRALFLRGGLLASRGERAQAVLAYSELTRRFSAHRLADDASLKMAMAYQAMGSEKQFVEVLGAMPERYPEGDMTQEGLFQLALNYMLRRDWGPSVAILERAEKLGQGSAVVRQVERDRVHYFLATCRLEQKLTKEGLAGLEALVKTRPLSYYMLLAYSRLHATSKDAASRAIAAGFEAARAQRSAAALTYVPSDPRLKRVIALLATGDLEVASVQMLGLAPESGVNDAFWTMVELYAHAGAWQTALSMVKSRAEDIRAHWPAQDFIPNWQKAYPRPYSGLVRKNAEENQVPDSLIYAIMREESEFEPSAVSSAQAYGLMQLIVPTAVTAAKGTAFRATAKTLLTPATNIALGTRVLRELLSRFDGRTVLAVAGYNAGPGRPKRWLKERPETPLDLWVEAIEYAETRGYVKRVMESRAAYGWLYSSDAERPALEPLPLTLSLH